MQNKDLSRKLAINGGKPIREHLFPAPNFFAEEEKIAVANVLDSGILSGFLGSWHETYFYGGSKVREFESLWSEFVGSKHSVSFNSNTSGLVAAVGAVGVGPGDEVIVAPYSMSATATAVLAYHAVPVFADIKDDIYCLDPVDIRKKITKRTKAIVVVDLFGHPADMDQIMEIANEHNIFVIEDAAQAPGAVYKNKMVGTLSDITVFSLNVHKHIHTGEGGVATTDDDGLAERLQLIRNHGESVVEGKEVADIMNTFGFNTRYTEIHAAIAIEQLKKLPKLLEWRIENAKYLNSELSQFPGVSGSVVRKDCKHVYYVQPMEFNRDLVGVERDVFVDAVAAELPSSPDREGIPLVWSGYGKPLYLLPMYQQKSAIGGKGCPFACPHYEGHVDYSIGICPVVEKVEKESLFMNDFIRPPATVEDMRDVVRAFEKVYENKDQLLGR
ncbi:MAG: DegT/DnrJ/EryC1/StrS family aminotransferase [Chloroflexota bacterium]|nr:DegT/DnrJ/EryC1/StrS family aminotransferase [Chloroflexota bacterium]